eukprot:Partr_v1_DN25297_c0_g1_i2_m16530 putative nucleotidase
MERELQLAIKAVRLAARVTQRVSPSSLAAQQGTLIKSDASPVTIADFAAQAIVNSCLHSEFPDDPIVGEEDASDLRSNSDLLSRVTAAVNCENGTGGMTENEVLQHIDRGTSQGAVDRFWTLDPIDGTKGFLRGEQYAICLALVVGGEVEVGVLACPNLPQTSKGIESRGLLFGAVRGQGAFQFNLNDPASRASIHVSNTAETSDACFCESVESGHSNQSFSSLVAESLGINKSPLRMDSQCKYGMIASGRADIYLRLPTRKDYQEKIWDHAAGDLIVREAGGVVTDIHGKRLDFTRGRLLSGNQGVIASNPHLHSAVQAAVVSQLSKNN